MLFHFLWLPSRQPREVSHSLSAIPLRTSFLLLLSRSLRGLNIIETLLCGSLCICLAWDLLSFLDVYKMLLYMWSCRLYPFPPSGARGSFTFLLEQDKLSLGCSFNALVFSVVSQTPVLLGHCLFDLIVETGSQLTSISHTFGALSDSALAEPQNPITTRMFGIMQFCTYHPLPYCYFLGNSQKREFLFLHLGLF